MNTDNTDSEKVMQINEVISDADEHNEKIKSFKNEIFDILFISQKGYVSHIFVCQMTFISIILLFDP